MNPAPQYETSLHAVCRMTPEEAVLSSELTRVVQHPVIASTINGLRDVLTNKRHVQVPPWEEVNAWARYEVAKMIRKMYPPPSCDQVVQTVQRNLVRKVEEQMSDKPNENKEVVQAARQFETLQRRAIEAGIPATVEDIAAHFKKPLEKVREYYQAWLLLHQITMHCEDVVTSHNGPDIGFPRSGRTSPRRQVDDDDDARDFRTRPEPDDRPVH